MSDFDLDKPRFQVSAVSTEAARKILERSGDNVHCCIMRIDNDAHENLAFHMTSWIDRWIWGLVESVQQWWRDRQKSRRQAPFSPNRACSRHTNRSE